MLLPLVSIAAALIISLICTPFARKLALLTVNVLMEIGNSILISYETLGHTLNIASLMIF